MIEGLQHYLIIRQGYEVHVFYGTGPQKNELFQTFNLKRPEKVSQHQCGNDLYQSTLIIPSRRQIIVTHTVKGPKKEYIMRTHYQRF